jgi:hypothetical protein
MAQHDIFEALLDMDIPTSFCHRSDDRVVTINNLPSANDMSTNSNLEMYNPPLAFLRPRRAIIILEPWRVPFIPF